MTPFEVISELNERGARNGVGRIDLTENRLVGMKSRGCYETPGGTIIYKALRAIEQLVLDKSTRVFREHLAVEFAQLVYDGRWFTRLRDILQAAADECAKEVNGKVVLKLYKGNIDIIQKDSPNSLFNFDFVTFGADQVYSQADGDGFIRLYTLPSRIRAINEAARKK
jgi:argininosuccinate synthase